MYFNIGTSITNFKQIDLEITLKDNISPDTFDFSIVNNKLFIKRTDCTVSGWGHNHDIIINNHYTLNIGTSETNCKYLDLNVTIINQVNSDTFNFNLDNNQLTINKTDSGIGWSYNYDISIDILREMYNNTTSTIKVNSIIPKNIFQTWSTKELSPKMKETVECLKSQNPEFTHFLFDDNDCRQFIQEYFDSDVLDAYDTLIPGAYKADLWRYCVLYIHGGIYLDIKYSCINGFKLITLTDKEYFVRDRFDNCIYNAFLVTSPKNVIMIQCINKIVENIKNDYFGNTPLHPTGPALLGSYFTNEYINYLPIYFNRFEETNEEIIMLNNNGIIKNYTEYREEQEQLQFQQNKHYDYLWKNRNIYQNDWVYMFIPRDSGFFSVINFLIGTISCGYKLYPYFNYNKMIEHCGKIQHFSYLDKNKDNCWFDFFEPIKFFENDNTHNNLNNNINYKISHGYEAPKEFRVPSEMIELVTNEHSFKEWRYKINKIFETYIKFTPSIVDKVKEITDTFNHKMIAVHYRHPAHCCESGFKYFNNYFNKIDDIILSNPDMSIFLATDTDIGIAAFTMKYGSKVIFNKDILRTSIDNILQWAFSLIESKPDNVGLINNIGFELHTSENNKNNTKLAYDVLIDTLCISKCNYFICSSSNISLAVSYINPEIEMIFI